MIKGIGASSGVALAKVLVVNKEELHIEKRFDINIEDEINKYNDSLELSKKELEQMKEKVKREIGDSEAEIFEVHIMLLEDEGFKGRVIELINEENNADYALYLAREEFASIFEFMDDEYMKERATDIRDISDRVLRHILGIKNVDLASLKEDVILAVHDLTPSDTAIMDKKRVKGFITEVGGRTSHTAIMARTLEIPAVVGATNILSFIQNEDFIVLDGETGDIMVNPKEEVILKYKEKSEVLKKEREELNKFIGVETKTLDGKHIELVGNIGSPNDIDVLLNNDAEGVGLYRTEFLYMDKKDSFPTEEEQFEAYKKVLEAMNGKPVIIRTLDIGGDKELPYFEIEHEMNPFLGYRAVRLCLDRKDIFKTQLRALYRASAFGKLRIMFPMISNLKELMEVKSLINEVLKELDEENISYKKDVEIGMMIEVPSSALMTDILAKHVDFFSIGTNDLIQYTCAVDRMNPKVSHLYDQFNIGVLRLIKMVIDNAHKEGKWVGMCGESASNERMIKILLGMGLDEFSMSPSSILKSRKIINETSSLKMKTLVEGLLVSGNIEDFNL